MSGCSRGCLSDFIFHAEHFGNVAQGDDGAYLAPFGIERRTPWIFNTAGKDTVRTLFSPLVRIKGQWWQLA
ncbi:MAG: hypothetical protein AB9917_22835 [Negativicutes bacterium]